MMQPPIAISAPKNPDMSPAAIDQRLRELAQIYKLGMSLRDAKWLGPVNAVPPATRPRLHELSSPGSGMVTPDLVALRRCDTGLSFSMSGQETVGMCRATCLMKCSGTRAKQSFGDMRFPAKRL